MKLRRASTCASRALAKLAKISESFSPGELSYSKVRAMTRIATADHEEVLADREFKAPLVVAAMRGIGLM